MRSLLAFLMTVMLCFTVFHTGETMAHGLVEKLEHHVGGSMDGDHAIHEKHVETDDSDQHIDRFHHAHDTVTHLLVVVPTQVQVTSPPLPRGHVPLPVSFTRQHSNIRIDRPPRRA
jgi:hypothetical protein